MSVLAGVPRDNARKFPSASATKLFDQWSSCISSHTGAVSIVPGGGAVAHIFVVSLKSICRLLVYAVV